MSLRDCTGSGENLHDDLAAGLRELSGIAGNKSIRLAKQGAKPIPALVTAPTHESAFMAGLELIETTITARVARCDMKENPALQTIWEVEGADRRLVRFLPYSASILMFFEDAKN